MNSNNPRSSIISLSDVFGSLVVEGDGIKVEFKDGNVIVHSGNIVVPGQSLALSGTTPAATLKVGDALQDGPNRGWVYCETAEKEPFIVAPKDSGVMAWQEAMDFAEREKSNLPTDAELLAMFNARGKGMLAGTFDTSGGYPGGWYWSGTREGGDHAWCRRFGSGGYPLFQIKRASVRCVRRYSQ